MNLLGIALLLVGSNGIACSMCHQRIRHRKQLYELAELFSLLEGEIRCHKAVLEEAVLALSEKMSGFRKSFLQELFSKIREQNGQRLERLWEQSVEAVKKQTVLSEEELQYWTEIGGRIGYLDYRMQEELLQQAAEMFRKWGEQRQREEAQTCRLYRTFGAAGGLLAVVLLL